MSLFHVRGLVLRAPCKLTEHEVASWVWPRLERAYPDALAATLMDDHAHAIVQARDADAARAPLVALISGLRRSTNPAAGARWERVEDPKPIPNAKHALRQARYVDLNPSRDGKVADPLEWAWSTHRDVVGATMHPWVTADRLAAALGLRAQGLAEWYHHYVSGDPTVDVAGTPMPKPAVPTIVAVRPLATVVVAAAAALRGLPSDVRRISPVRELFLHLARACGWTDRRLLAEVCAVTPWAVDKALARPCPDLRPALLCLGDRRLRAYLEPIPLSFLEVRNATPDGLVIRLPVPRREERLRDARSSGRVRSG